MRWERGLRGFREALDGIEDGETRGRGDKARGDKARGDKEKGDKEKGRQGEVVKQWVDCT